MKWHLIESGSNTGSFNMDFDLSLIEKSKHSGCFFRLYQWDPYAISLGANQKLEDIDLVKTKESNIDVVKRPTGGRAILHAEEITYSVVMPMSSSLSAREIYRKISSALIEGLKDYDNKLSQVELENVQPDFSQVIKQPSGVMCFASTAKSEVKFNGKKLIGSAQRKVGNVILQHGSILCGTYHKNLTNYLANSDEQILSSLSDELNNKTIEIETITNEKTNYRSLSKSLIKGFEKQFEIVFGS